MTRLCSHAVITARGLFAQPVILFLRQLFNIEGFSNAPWMNGGLTVHVRSASIIPSVQPELMEMWSQECWVLCIIAGCGAAAVLCVLQNLERILKD